jgi:hypothetical protein
MGVVDDLLAYDATVLANVTVKTAINSIDPVVVGNIGTDLSATISPYMATINQEGISSGNSVPLDINGADGDRYYYNSGSTTTEYRKEGAVWVSKATISGTGGNKQTIAKSQTDLIEDGAGTGNYYLKYTDASGLAITAGIRPYSINSVQGTHEYGIPAIVEDDDTWDFPRIYGFQNVTQTITIYGI